jgi:excisionase family DNA binding protein
MNTENVTLNELLPLIYNQINKTVERATERILTEVLNDSKSNATIANDFLSAKEAADFLKIKLNTLYSKVEKGELPHSRSGKRKLLFCKKELIEFIESKKSKSNTQIREEAINYTQNNSL